MCALYFLLLLLQPLNNSLRILFRCRPDNFLHHVQYLRRMTLLAPQILNDRLTLDEQDAQRTDDDAIRQQVPGKEQPQHVDEQPEYNHTQVIHYLTDCPSEGMAADALFVRFGCINTRPEVEQRSEHGQQETHEQNDEPMAQVLSEM